MSKDNKQVKASEYYSRRIGKETEAGSDKETNKQKEHITQRNTSRAESSFHIRSSGIDDVTASVKKAAEQISAEEKDEMKMLSRQIVGSEAVVLAELQTARAVKRGTENIVKGARYTVTRFSREGRSRRKERKNYDKNKKEIKWAARQIKEWKKEEKTERKKERSEGRKPVLSEKYKKKQENLKREQDTLREQNRTIRKKMIAVRHSRSINRIKNRALSVTKETGNELAKTPNRFLLMLADDMEPDKLVRNASFSLIGTVTKTMTGIFKLLLSSIKNTLIAISPLLFAAVLVIFMIYIMFFSDFDSYFDMGIEKDMISSEASEDVGTVITTYIVKKRNEMAKELTDSDHEVQVYFLKLSEETVDEVVSYMEEKAKDSGNPFILFDEWMQSREADEILETLVTAMCYRLSEEEVQAYPEEQLEAYNQTGTTESETIAGTEPETGTQKEVPPDIGAGMTGGIGRGIGSVGTGGNAQAPTEPEEPTEQVGQTGGRAVIGYHSIGWLLENHKLGDMEELYQQMAVVRLPEYSMVSAFTKKGDIFYE